MARDHDGTTSRASYAVVVRRANGRFVKRIPGLSRYAAKLQARVLREKYDPSYIVAVRDHTDHERTVEL
jgi:hypothetical protein